MLRYGLGAYMLLLSSMLLIEPIQEQIIFADPKHYSSWLKHRHVILTIAESSEIVLHEGFPHPREHELLQNELKTKMVNKIANNSFYRDTHKLNGSDEAWLKEFFQSARHFEPYIGPKACGGFHADYCVEWTVKHHRYYCLICFGCREVLLIMENDSLRCDLGTDDSRQKLFNFLFRHRKSRPLSRHLQEMLDYNWDEPVAR